MEKKELNKAQVHSCQLDLFTQIHDVKPEFTTPVSITNIKTSPCNVVYLFDYMHKQEIDKFYDEVHRLTAHLD